MAEYVLLCLAALLGGAVNSVAGGGTLITFPALFGALGPASGAAVVANMTSTVALVPGSIAAAWGYRRELSGLRHWVVLLVGPSLVGGLIGSLMVTRLPESSFEAAVPWLILTAVVLLALQPRIARWMGIGRDRSAPPRRTAAAVAGFQLLVGIYGGYFGAGIGILMLSALAMMGIADIHKMNALKNLFAACINGVSVAVFVADGRVHWPFALAMAGSAIAGGFLGAKLALRLDKNLVRRGVVTIGFVLAAYYFWRQWS